MFTIPRVCRKCKKVFDSDGLETECNNCKNNNG